MARLLRILIAVVAALVAALVLSGAVAVAVGLALRCCATIEPSAKARLLGEGISEAMNCSVLFAVIALPTAIMVAWKGVTRREALRVVLVAIAAMVGSFAIAAIGVASSQGPRAAPGAERQRQLASEIAEAMYDGSFLAFVAVPVAGFLAVRRRRGA